MSDGTLGADVLDRRPLGEGEFPDELARFNWFAYFFPWLWSALYGVWWPYLIFAAQILIGPGLRLALPEVFASWVTYSYLRAGWAVVVGGFLVWYGVNANSLAWRAAGRRSTGRMTRTIDGLGRGQRLAFLIGVIVLSLGWASALSWAARSPQGLHAIRVSASAILGVNVIGLGAAIYLSKTAHGRLWRLLKLREH